MRSFALHRPSTLYETSALLGGVADSMPLAGGMTLLPTIKQRLAAPAALIDLSKIPQMSGISFKDDVLTIGAMTRHVDVAESELVRSKIPLLASLAAGIGDPAVRNRGTIGGSVANNDPSADYPAAVLALDAIVVTDRREIAADAFFRGLFETALEPGEIIIALRFPVPSAGGYAKFKSPASRYAVVGVCAVKKAGKVRVAVTGAGPGVFRVGAMEAALEGSFTPAAIAAIRVSPENLSSDIHADAEYRAHLVTVMAKKAIAAALQTL
ncbi:xanthine dehydrogenase family protein subunit M [Bradyrhizobium sp. JYMT SZCCT0428]|uniref:FAD binding domain-containing protein n=1 Tax=Bradyrhizobium sp. JYMT SZCCT0428 TaxID=2807673 RepID=UPI001BA50867|nr:xanthine dehydrogenase family protein subunit M [Bradyrhizobium sp. JYMT SZCCT0428]MBR1150339.1 xanthine dehydrogenase family protein subunit M [Bradyrhizobium sp. JYMT SZCCT0428]